MKGENTLLGHSWPLAEGSAGHSGQSVLTGAMQCWDMGAAMELGGVSNASCGAKRVVRTPGRGGISLSAGLFIC